MISWKEERRTITIKNIPAIGERWYFFSALVGWRLSWVLSGDRNNGILLVWEDDWMLGEGWSLGGGVEIFRVSFEVKFSIKLLTNRSQYAMNITFSIGREMWVRESLNLVL